MQNRETVVDQVAEVARCLVSTVTCAEIIYAAFQAVSRFFGPGSATSPDMAGETTPVDFGLQHTILPAHRLAIQSRTVQI
jgi:hypothetical protein